MTQEFFDTDDYASRADCIVAKKIRIRELRKQGCCVISSILKGQQRGYHGYGTERDTSCRDVFMITIV